MNLFSMLDRGVGKWPEAIAIVDHRREITYREFHAAVERLAAEMRSAGMRAGDKAGVLFSRGIEDIVACFAVARLGGIVVQISPASKAAEVARLSEKLNLDALVFSPEYEPVIPPDDRSALPRTACAQPFSVCIRRTGQRATSAAEREQLLTLNAAAIGFSSGTTSESKAIILSHDALLARARVETEIYSMGAGDNVLYLLSITYGFAPPIAAALLYGAKLIVADAGMPQRLLQTISEHKVDLVYAAPLNYRMLLNDNVSAAETFRGARFLVSTSSLGRCRSRRVLRQSGP